MSRAQLKTFLLYYQCEDLVLQHDPILKAHFDVFFSLSSGSGLSTLVLWTPLFSVFFAFAFSSHVFSPATGAD